MRMVSLFHDDNILFDLRPFIAVQYVGESLHGGSHLLERNDEPGGLFSPKESTYEDLCSTSDGPSLSTPLDNPRGAFKIVVPDFLL